MTGAVRLGPRAAHDGTRWTAARKAEVVESVLTGKVSVEDACRDHGLTGEELSSWVAKYGAEGMKGLAQKNLDETRPKRGRAH